MKKIAPLTFAIILMISCEAIFVENISDITVSTLAPSDGSSVSSGDITFSWEQIQDAESYELQVALPSFSNASQIVLDTLVTKTSVTKALSIGNYQWRIRAINSDYQTVYTTNSFTVN